MRKILLGLFSSVVIVILPLAGHIHLILSYKMILVIIGIFSIWLTQPAVTAEETSEHKNVDRFSVLLIIIMSFLSTIIPIIDWAYFKSGNAVFSIWTFIGIGLIITGIVFRYWAVKTLGKFFTATVQIQHEHELIVTGPYSIVRHPSYTGAFFSISAGSVLLESWVGLIFSVLALSIAYYRRIKIEESELKNYFGHSYELYCQKTKRIIPYIL